MSINSRKFDIVLKDTNKIENKYTFGISINPLNKDVLENAFDHIYYGFYRKDKPKLPENMSGFLKTNLEDLLKLPAEKLSAIRDHINGSLKGYDYDNEMKTLKTYILDEWGNCDNLRSKIENEGTGYFYSEYTSVPVSWDIYNEFCENEDDCFCGTC